MSTVTVSPKFQIVIPKTIRESRHIRSGMKLSIVDFDDGLYIIPIRPMKTLRGSLKGMDTTIVREKDRF